MANSNTTLASLWMDDGQGSPSKFTPETPTKVGFLDANGDLMGYTTKDQIIASKPPVQIIAVPMTSPVKMSPYKETYLSKSQVIIPPNQIVNQSSPRTIMPVDSRWSGKKRSVQQSEITLEADFTDSKRGKRGEKGGKGLRHFSMKVCEKVQKKGVTSYNEVADELVAEFTDPRNMAATSDQAYDQKNIRRRVYDALNVLMAMNIISKEKKEIRWIGLPTNSAQECQNLETEKQNREARIKQKTQQLQDLIIQQIAFKNLVQRNKDLQKANGCPPSNSAIHLPFIIVNTSKKTVIDCSISNDKYEYLFNFDNTFEIHDDIEVLKRMGMALGLEKGDCNQESLEKAIKMVPKSFQSYVIEMATSKSIAGPSCSGIAGMAAVGTPQSRYKPITPLSPLSVPSIQQASSDVTDMEVAMATGHGLSRQSSYSDMHSRTATETPSDNFSDDSDSDRSSPIDIS